MKKKGLIGVIILVVLGILLVVGIGAGVYFYNYHVFKEIRVCIGEGQDTRIPCVVREDCLDVFNISLDVLGDFPGFVKDKVEEVLGKVVYCEGSCFIRITKGIDFESGGIEMLESCEAGEDEVVMEIRGKEGLEILSWMKSREQ